MICFINAETQRNQLALLERRKESENSIQGKGRGQNETAYAGVKSKRAEIDA